MYQAIIFDVSDTLIEYRPSWAEVFGGKIRALGFETTEETVWAIGNAVYRANKQHSGMDEAALSCVPCPREKSAACLWEMARVPMPEQEMSVIPGVFETLEVLKTDYRLAIVSNHFCWLPDYLKECGLWDYFESIIVSEIVGVEKPDVRIMELVLRELNLPPARCLYVGDQPMDVLCAKDAGMDCAWIARKETKLPDSIPYKEDYRIGSVRDLPGILKENV